MSTVLQTPKALFDEKGNHLLLVRKDEYEALLERVRTYEEQEDEEDWQLYQEGKEEPFTAEPLSVVLKRVKEDREKNGIK